MSKKNDVLIVRVNIAGVKTIEMPISELDEFIKNNYDLVMNSNKGLRRRVAKATGDARLAEAERIALSTSQSS